VIEPHVVDVVPANVIGLLGQADLWIDGTDNFEVRFLINDAALHLKKPWVHGGCVATHGQIMLFWPGRTCCFQCLVPTAPARGESETCDTVGVLGPATSAIASLQSSMALRAIVEGEQSAEGKLYSLDFWSMSFRTMKTEKLLTDGCEACRNSRFSHLDGKANPEPQILCGQNAIQFPASSSVDLDVLSQRLRGVGKTERARFFVRCDLESERITVFKDGRVVVEGTQDLARARSLIHQLLGG
jgi:adenylyltransferase/sulfurtransferase